MLASNNYENNVLLFGYLLQLPPISQAQVFQNPSRMIQAVHLWQLFPLVELTRNMRQQGDTTFIDILNALRIGQFSTQHLKVRMDQVTTESTGEFSIEQALRMFPTKKQADEHNNMVLEYSRT